MKKNKVFGQIYTDKWLVCKMLDQIEYFGTNTLNKKIIDNSCGNGNFLVEIVDRIIHASRANGLSETEIKDQLESNVYGIEIDSNSCAVCVERLNGVLSEANINASVNWNVINADTTIVYKDYTDFDFVVANPPYVRTQTLSKVDSLERLKEFSVMGSGCVDLYYAFYEIGFGMLKNDGKLCYVTPSHWLTAKSGEALRKFIIAENSLSSIIDFGCEKLFDKIGAYCAIFSFDRTKLHPSFSVEYNGEVTHCLLQDMLIDGKLYVGNILPKEREGELRKIKASRYVNNNLHVKNGIATLADKVFIGDFAKNFEHSVKAFKGGRCTWHHLFYPYDRNGVLLPFEQLTEEEREHVNNNYKALKDRSIGKGKIHAFGRSQALKDTYKDKLSLPVLIKSVSDVKCEFIPSGCCVYAGIYITFSDGDLMKIKEMLQTQEYVDYVKSLGHYKGDGWYGVGAPEVVDFLNYKLNEQK